MKTTRLSVRTVRNLTNTIARYENGDLSGPGAEQSAALAVALLEADGRNVAATLKAAR